MAYPELPRRDISLCNATKISQWDLAYLTAGLMTIMIIPLDFNSTVHPLSSSCTSSGSTDFRVHASSQRGFCGSWIAASCAPFLTFAGPSLPFSLEKKLGMVVVVVVALLGI